MTPHDPPRPEPPDRLRFEEEGMGTSPEGGLGVTLNGFLWAVFTIAVGLLLVAPWVALGAKISVAGAMTLNAITLLISLIVISVAREEDE